MPLAIDLVGVIPEDEAVLVSSNQGLPIVMASVNGSSAGQAFRNIARRLDGEEVPLLDLMATGNLWERVRDWVNNI